MRFHPKLPGGDKIREHLRALQRRWPSSYVTVPILVLAWILSGIYTVAPGELGVIQRFGKLARTAEPGLHYHLPYPIESLNSPKVTEIQRLEFGFRTPGPDSPQQYRPMPDEALMLTKDENIIDLWFIVQFRIQNATNFLFKVADAHKAMRDAAEATMREVVGANNIDEAMTTGRFEIQAAAQKTLQQILDSYESGLQVITVQLQAVQPPERVRDAFKEVISAREEKNKSINEAESYASDILPTARGLAVQTEYEAEAYKEQKIQQAQGDTARFLSLLKEYRKAEDVTRKRLYLETMEEIVSKARKLVVDSDKQGVLPLWPLQELGRPPSETPSEKQGLR
ncbi:MAG: FtsH protease activity modulator HflK [Desulfobacterales bacterium]|nr:MAG: FtsH protease activity modulator HflK [Desulfobacterales bacterium]